MDSLRTQISIITVDPGRCRILLFVTFLPVLAICTLRTQHPNLSPLITRSAVNAAVLHHRTQLTIYTLQITAMEPCAQFNVIGRARTPEVYCKRVWYSFLGMKGIRQFHAKVHYSLETGNNDNVLRFGAIYRAVIPATPW